MTRRASSHSLLAVVDDDEREACVGLDVAGSGCSLFDELHPASRPPSNLARPASSLQWRGQERYAIAHSDDEACIRS